MSAIAGIYQRDGRPLAPALIDRMMASLAHRGPDGSGIWRQGAVGLGHQMLWGTPESLNERLPLGSEDGSRVVTSDARIDNRADLFRELEIAGSEQTLPDSMLILRAYERWGTGCAAHLLGDFAFAIWDGRERRLLCATDAMGAKPFYYHRSPCCFAFASEIKALLTLPQVPKLLNEERIAENLLPVLSEPDSTCFAGVRALPAGRVLLVEPDEIRERSYWRPDQCQRIRLASDDDTFDAVRAAFFEAVRCRLRSPARVASFLSGGLDSSSVTCVAASLLQQSGRELVALSSVLPEGYTGPERDERRFIELVRSWQCVPVEYVTAAGYGPYDGLERTFRLTETGQLPPRHYLYRALHDAAQDLGARVVLDGFGGEVGPTSHGHGYLAELARSGHWLRLIHELRLGTRHTSWSLSHVVRQEVFRPLLPTVALRAYRRMRGTDLHWSALTPMSEPFARRMQVEDRLHQAGFDGIGFRPAPSARANVYRGLELLRQPRGLLAPGHCQEVRFPFLDQRLVELCLSVPIRLIVRDGWRRYLMRRAMEGVLPPAIQWRISKHPFSPDYYRRLRDGASNAWSYLSQIGPTDPVREYVDVDRIKRALASLGRQDSWEPTAPGDPAMLVIHQGMHMIGFLRWFDAYTPWTGAPAT